MSAVVERRRTVSIPQFAREWGISLPLAYELARKDELPAPVFRLGRRMVISRDALEELLAKRKGIGDEGLAA